MQNPQTWTSFETAVAAATDEDSVAGDGFVFTDDDPFVGVDLDLDDCRDAETDEADLWAREVNDHLDLSAR